MSLDPNQLHAMAADIQTAEHAQAQAHEAQRQVLADITAANATYAKAQADLKRQGTETFTRLNAELDKTTAAAAAAKTALEAKRAAMQQYISEAGGK